ncbi:prolipoprotein diacylglyceryl transferase [Gilvimarinus xylanilyticus]|uniref:Phosphatidylglycerol--prolipoprotein diacylglyceryl transferase n=1 Tax=Gilvimarinus xylanilyticus TaxID=2944139 RepID=A0A9X2KUY9_9GAMM|nr:prolipoprotein diacylglyceryl transferase [Gilvimarinus xylanilyticus]MCP8900702.1 prolipoprotein diacylglyceryl transferase [Gilvimarinus xylanilyticus]
MLTHPDFDPVALSLGPLDVHWYGIMYLFAFASAWFIAMRRARRDDTPISQPQVENLITYGAFGVVLGGRIGYVVFYNFEAWMRDPLLLFRLWEGGMSFHGGLIGVLLAMLFYAHRIHIPYLRLTDFVAPIVPLGLAFGRLGNFIGQELWGRPTEGPWAMVFPKDPELLPRHPSQLYQFAMEGVLLFIIVYVFSRKPRPTGAVSGVFLVGYACFRIIVEFAREPDQHIQFDLYGWVTRGQLLSLPMLALGIGLLVYAYKFPKLDKQGQSPEQKAS